MCVSVALGSIIGWYVLGRRPSTNRRDVNGQGKTRQPTGTSFAGSPLSGCPVCDGFGWAEESRAERVPCDGNRAC